MTSRLGLSCALLRRPLLSLLFMAELTAGETVRLPLEQSRPSRVLEGHEGEVYALAFSSDGSKLATGGYDETVRLWDVPVGKHVGTLTGHEAKVLCLAFSPDGRTVVGGSQDKTLRLWATSGDSAGEREPMRTFGGHEGAVHGLAFAPDGSTIASAGGDKTVRLWNPADGKQIRAMEAHDSSVYAVCYSPDGQLLASGGLDRKVKIWNPADGKEVVELKGHDEGVFCLCFSADGKFLYSGSSDRTVRRWDVAEGREVQLFEGHLGWVCGLGLLADTCLSADYGGELISWNAVDGTLLSHHKVLAVAYTLALSPQGSWIATAGPSGTVSLFALSDLKIPTAARREKRF